VVLLLLLALAAVAPARVVLTGNITISPPTAVVNASNIPMQFWVVGDSLDSAYDKTCYTDSTGKWLIEFDSVNSGASFRFHTAAGTSFGTTPEALADHIDVIVPQTWNSCVGCNGATQFGRGDTFVVDASVGGTYVAPLIGPGSLDTTIIQGIIADINTGNGIKEATITVTFHDYYLNRDTTIITNSSSSNFTAGSFSFTFFNNHCYTQCKMHVQATGYPNLDSLVPIPGVWNGKTDTLNANLSMGMRGFVPDTFQIAGTVKNGTPGVTGFPPVSNAVVAISLALYPDSTNFIDTIYDTTAASGNFSWNYVNTTKAAKALCRLTVSAKNFSTLVKSGLYRDSLNLGGQLIPSIFSDVDISALADSTDSIVVRGYIKDSTDTRALPGATALISAGDSTYSYAKPNPASATADANGFYVTKIRNASKLTHVYVKVVGSKAGYLPNTITKDTSGIKAGDMKNDTITMADLKLDTNNGGYLPDSVIVAGVVKDSSGVKALKFALASIRIGTDGINYASPILDTADSNGKYSVTVPNPTAINHLYIKVVAGGVFGYLSGTVNKEATFTAGDGVNDLITMPVDSIKIDRTIGDTLFVRGTVDSISFTKPFAGVSVKIDLGGTANSYVVDTTVLTNSSGVYEYKIFNSANVGTVYYKITFHKQGFLFLDSSVSKQKTFISNDRINDTIDEDKIWQPPTFIANRAALLPLIKFPVSIYDLSGRLIKSFVYETTGSTAGLPKYLRSIGVFQKMYIMEIGEKSGIVRKQMINLK